MEKNKTNKFRLTCTAPSEMTQYNHTYNAILKQKCEAYREDPRIFDPNFKCAGCGYLEIKGYKK